MLLYPFYTKAKLETFDFQSCMQKYQRYAFYILNDKLVKKGTFAHLESSFDHQNKTQMIYEFRLSQISHH